MEMLVLNTHIKYNAYIYIALQAYPSMTLLLDFSLVITRAQQYTMKTSSKMTQVKTKMDDGKIMINKSPKENPLGSVAMGEHKINP